MCMSLYRPQLQAHAVHATIYPIKQSLLTLHNHCDSADQCMCDCFYLDDGSCRLEQLQCCHEGRRADGNILSVMIWIAAKGAGGEVADLMFQTAQAISTSIQA